MTKTSLLPVLLFLCLCACKKEQDIQDAPKHALKAQSPLIKTIKYGTDWSGTVQIAIVTAEATGTNPHVNVDVPEGYALVGGGAVITPEFEAPGAFLTAAYPDANFTTWHAVSTQHLATYNHTLVGYAIGLKLTGLTKQELITNMILVTDSSEIAPHPATSSTVSDNYFLIGGGAKVTYSDTPNVLVASHPSGNTWHVSSKDHIVSSPATIKSYAIGIKKFNSVYGNLDVAQAFESTYALTGFGVTDVYADNSWVVTSPGGKATYNDNWGRMLYALEPNLRSVQAVTNDIYWADSGETFAYLIKMRKPLIK